MRLYDEDVFSCLEANENESINNGFGYFIKRGISEEQIDKLRKYHDEDLGNSKPYWILDFLEEDYKLDPDCVEVDPIFGCFRKYKPKSKNKEKKANSNTGLVD